MKLDTQVQPMNIKSPNAVNKPKKAISKITM